MNLVFDALVERVSRIDASEDPLEHSFEILLRGVAERPLVQWVAGFLLKVVRDQILIDLL